MATLPRLMALWLAASAASSAWAVVEIDGLDNLDLGGWTPTVSGLTGYEDFCVAARRGSSSNAGPYEVMVEPLSGPQFELASIAEPGVTLPITLSFEDLQSGVTAPLTPYVFSPREMSGVADCIGADNARIQVSLTSGDLATAPPGDYQGVFRFTGRGTANRTLSRDFSISLRTQPLIRISGLDPIDLGAYDGINDLQGGDEFCVYSNGPGGSYTVTASGQGGNGAFAVQGGAATIPISVEFDDGTGFVPMSPNTPNIENNANGTALDCAGTANARIRVQALSTDLDGAAGGVYSGELTLIVAPI